MNSVSIIQLRESTNLSDGLDDEEDIEPACVAAGLVDEHAPNLLQIPPTASVLFIARQLAGAIAGCTAPLILLDLSVPSSSSILVRLDQAVAEWISDSVTGVGTWAAPDLLIVSQKPLDTPNYALSDAIRSPAASGHVVLVSLDQGVISPQLGPSRAPAALSRLANAFAQGAPQLQYRHHRRTLRRHTLRRRGVFEAAGKRREASPGVAGRADSRYFAFDYQLKARARQALYRLAKNYVRENDVKLVIYDEAISSTWLCHVLAEMSKRLPHLRVMTVEEAGAALVDSPPARGPMGVFERTRFGSTNRVLRALALRKPTELCLVVGATNYGHSLAGYLEALHLESEDKVRLLSVIMASRLSERVPATEGRAWDSTTLNVAGKHRSVDWFMSAPIQEFASESSWEVSAAMLLDDVRSLGTTPIDYADGSDDRDLAACEASAVGLWMLIQDLQVRTEGSRAEISWRNPVRYFPRFDAIDRWDAHWLAETMVRRFCARLDNPYREGLIVAVPSPRQDTKGLQSIVGALNRRCGVSTIQIDRSLVGLVGAQLEESSLEWLREVEPEQVVLFDETAVSRSTLASMAAIVRRAKGHDGRGRSVVLAGVVADLNATGRTELDFPLLSLLDYSHFAEVTESEA